jgi:hypothetical protein
MLILQIKRSKKDTRSVTAKTGILQKARSPFFRTKWSNLSEFVKEIKLGFSRYYNRRHNRRGFFWGDRFLSLDFGLKEFNVLDVDERLRLYRKFLYEKNSNTTEKRSQIAKKTTKKETKKDFRISQVDRFRYPTRYFSDSGIIGTKEFVAQNYQRFKHHFQSKNDKIPKLISGLDGVYSLKRLSSD